MDKTRCQFFLRGPVELVESRNEAGRAVRLLKEEAGKTGIDWPPGCVSDSPERVPVNHKVTIVELNCSIDEAKKLRDVLVADFVPPTSDRKLTVRAIDPSTGQRLEIADP